MIELLKQIESEIPQLLGSLDKWGSLDVNYFPPRVERLWMQYDDVHRLFIHVIHPTTEPCLFHKHRWPAAFKMIDGEYEMGISYSESEISSDEAYKIPVISKFIMSEGSYYEMVNTHTLHYVRPLGKPSVSFMLTGELYPESSFRKEVLDRKLEPLSDERKIEIANLVLNKLKIA